jgi:hypothetical protein
MSQIADMIRAEVLHWPNVVEGRGRFGAITFSVHGHELGHVHGSRLADLPLPEQVRDELIAAGTVSPHHIKPETGWVTYHLHGPESVAGLIALFQLNYERYQITAPA